MKTSSKDDMLVRALMDQTDFSSDERTLFQNSPDVLPEVETLRNDLDRLGKAARNLAPEPGGHFVPQSSDENRAARFIRRFAPAVACAAAVILMIAVLWPRFHMRPTQPDLAAILEEMENDHKFLNEIDRVVTYAQSGGYEDETETSDAVEGFLDEDFIDFLLPLENDTSAESGQLSVA